MKAKCNEQSYQNEEEEEEMERQGQLFHKKNKSSFGCEKMEQEVDKSMCKQLFK